MITEMLEREREHPTTGGSIGDGVAQIPLPTFLITWQKQQLETESQNIVRIYCYF